MLLFVCFSIFCHPPFLDPSNAVLSADFSTFTQITIELPEGLEQEFNSLAVSQREAHARPSLSSLQRNTTFQARVIWPTTFSNPATS